MPARSVLVAGAGDVGAAVGQALVHRGDRVIALRRDISRLAAGLEGLRADLTEVETLRRVPRGLDALVFCAAADRRDPQAYRSLYVDGLRNVLDTAGPVGCVVFTSTTGVYGQRDGSWVDEHAPTEPVDFTGRVMLEAEGVALAADTGRAHVLRLGGIYGPGRTRLIDQIRRGEATDVGGARRFTNRIHRDDAAAAILYVLDRPDAPRLLNVVDDDPAERREVLRWIAAQAGVPAPLPAAGAPGDVAHDEGKRVSNALLRSLGWRPRYPGFRDGYAGMLG